MDTHADSYISRFREDVSDSAPERVNVPAMPLIRAMPYIQINKAYITSMQIYRKDTEYIIYFVWI